MPKPYHITQDTTDYDEGFIELTILTYTYIVEAENSIDESVVLGELAYTCNTVDGVPAGYSSTGFFCPTCGDLWGRIDLEIPSWQVQLRPCQAHGDGSVLFWEDVTEADVARMPRALMEYEFYVSRSQTKEISQP